MPRKPVIPPGVADALTADKPKAARVVQSLAPAPPDNADALALAPAPLEELAEKDVDTLTAEILTLEAHGVAVVLEIGKRLIAVKEKLAHGDWLPWLERVNITPSYAQRYMRLAREWTGTTSMAYLGMTKMLALLALPEAERDGFMAESHVVGSELKSVEEMSVRQLQEAVQAANEARQSVEERLQEAERRLSEDEAENERVRGELALARQRLAIADAAKAKADAERDEERQKRFEVADELERLKNKPIDVAVETVVDEKAIEAARQKERESMQFLVDSANSERDASRLNCQKAEAALEAVTKELNDERRGAQAALEAVTKERNDERRRAHDAAQRLSVAKVNFEAETQTLKRALADAEQRAKASPIADTDLQKFAVLFEQVQASVNQMHGIALKQPDDKREKLKNALLSLAESIRKAAK